jgi:hypothetical protein
LIVAIIFGVASYRQYRRAERAKVAADQAAKRATLASDEAQKLINFMTVDLRDKLKPIGRLDLLDDVNKRVMSYYDHLVGSETSPKIQSQRSLALVNYAGVALEVFPTVEDCSSAGASPHSVLPETVAGRSASARA